MPEMNYATIETGKYIDSGLNPVSENYPARTVLVYIGTDDIDASLAEAESLGGKIVTSKTEIPGTAGKDFSLILLAKWLDCTPPWNQENIRSHIASPTPRTGCEDAAACIIINGR